ncbi:MAG TPA: hypothetical protein VGC29_00300 [Flavisolibacter sp.]
MPDLITVFEKRWKFILGLTVLAAAIALVATLLSPKKFLSVATALPANSLTADKARLFNSNIEALYSEFGTPDELDKLEGTAMLDTIYIAAVNDLGLASHYGISESGESSHKAVEKLKKNSKLSRSAYGELKVKVWDKDRNRAAEIANALMKNLQDLHRYLQNENNKAMLATLQKEKEERLVQFRQANNRLDSVAGAEVEVLSNLKSVKLEQLQELEKMIGQYQLAVNANPQVLLSVEQARPAVWHDKPKIWVTVLLSAFVAFASAFIMALFVESRKP